MRREEKERRGKALVMRRKGKEKEKRRKTKCMISEKTVKRDKD